jgi:hypothetical protein
MNQITAKGTVTLGDGRDYEVEVSSETTNGAHHFKLIGLETIVNQICDNHQDQLKAILKSEYEKEVG